MNEASRVFLSDSTTGEIVLAELLCGIETSHLLNWHNEWQPALGAIKATLSDQGVPKALWPQSSHWDWADKAAKSDEILAFESYCLTCEGMTQAMMRVDTVTRTSRLEGLAGKPLVYVDYLEVAPWNQSFAGTPKKYRGAGTVMITAAAALSFEQDFKGRVGLHSLPQSENFYRGMGLVDFGPDPQVHGNLHYFELTSERAQALTAQE